MSQITLVINTFEPDQKARRLRTFVRKLDRSARWVRRRAVIDPVYPKTGNGRPPIGLVRMLPNLLPAKVVQPLGPQGRGRDQRAAHHGRV
jgi:hypothetical protein